MIILDVIDVPSVEKFNKVVGEKEAFVQYFHPQCGHCQALEPEWTSMVETLKDKHGDADIVVAKIRHDMADGVNVEEEIQGYPTILVLKNGKKVNEYSGERTAAALLKYVKDNLTPMDGSSQSGGKRKRRRRKRKTRKHRKRRKKTRRRRRRHRRRRHRRTFKKRTR